MSRKKVHSDFVYDIWMCMHVDCDNEETTEINPAWYQNNGTPVCPECDCDMDYQHTEIDEAVL